MFFWRGYRACVKSNIPKLTTHELRRRFDLAKKILAENSNRNQNQYFKRPSLPEPEPKQQPEPESSDLLSEDLSQIPETQFDMEGIIILYSGGDLFI